MQVNIMSWKSCKEVFWTRRYDQFCQLLLHNGVRWILRLKYWIWQDGGCCWQQWQGWFQWLRREWEVKKKKKAFQLKWYNNPYQHPYCESELQFPFSPQTFLALWYQNHMVVLEIIIPLPLCSPLHILRACCLFTNDKVDL